MLLTFLPPALLYLIFPNGLIPGIGGATVRHHLGGNNSCCTGNQSPQKLPESDVHGLGRQSSSGDCHSLWRDRHCLLVR
ncbi:hypothetical protein ACNKHM_12590 [Shigella sonnei]